MTKLKTSDRVSIVICLIVVAILILLLTSCKKEEGPSCGVCDYIEQYSHNDSTFTITGNKFCDKAYESIDSEYHVYNDTMSGVPTTVENYYNCTK